MYAMTELMLPMASSPETDWLAHFNSVRKWFFGMIAVLVLLGVMLNVYISGVPLVHPYRIMQCAIFSLGIIGWLTPNTVVHRWIAVLMILVLFGGQMLFRLWPGLSA
jgi:hypothetical protein